MPMVDGLTSTKIIRAWEDDANHAGHSPLAQPNGRIPIFAVSASLVEKDRAIYMNAGFDGWILKPIDFKRLNTLLQGITNDAIREACLYEEGGWEMGGWFAPRSLSGKEATRRAEESEKGQEQHSQDATPTAN